MSPTTTTLKILIVAFVSAANAFPLWQCKMLEMTHDLSNDTMVAPLEVYMQNKFKLVTMTEGMAKSAKGGGSFYLYYNRFSAVEHISTHMDAPKHVLKDLKVAETAKTIDQVSLDSLVGEACVVDIPTEHLGEIDYLITIDDVKNWEKQHGEFHENCFVLIRSGQGKYWGDVNKYLGSDDPSHVDPETGWPDNTHWPGMHWETAKWILDNRGMKGIGQDAMSFDYGGMRDYSQSIHTVVLGANKPGFENLANLDKLPNRGAMIVAMPMFIKKGSGAPARVFAVGWNGDDDPCKVSSSAHKCYLGLFVILLSFLLPYINRF